ncbi:hypothetical protein [Morganella morganii]|uniref:hypothetical protein n=1 Tax=Morganella morganii TaxID=582 RepID=UPI00141A4A67|nr:hypothetical protein [Morganella morganii]NIH19459.1 hypothetical protein [Morganella morganii]
MYGYQCNVVTATAVQYVITAAVRQPDSFIFSDIRPLDTRKQAVCVLVLRKPNHHIYRVNSVNINGVFQYLPYGFLAHGVCRVMPVFKTVWLRSTLDRLAELPKQAAEAQKITETMSDNLIRADSGTADLIASDGQPQI